ncbi:MAG TPA: NTPase (NACHT family) [Acidobacteria bacterium]|nr:NTPase (NACHT family) [Acidobacteriota bacterium]
MDFEPDKIPETLQKLLEGVGIQPPLWLMQAITLAVLLGVLLCALWGVLFVASQIKQLAAEFVPPRLNRETRRRLARRRRFAEHVERGVGQLNIDQSWSDYRFAELEAEVEAEGRRRAVPFLPIFLPRTTSGLRRERSLTKAIDVSRERLLLIEGDPGSGKSVALRHVAMKLASRARRRGLRAVIPLYINLKEIDRPEGRAVDRNLIEEFILKTLNRANDRDVESFIEEEFGKGLEEGSWLFLFDSFDEIPEILGSTEPDAVIRGYTRAIDDFLHGMNRCRGVVASRYFRGPGQVQWPRFRILALSPERRRELVRKADLPTSLERELLGRLPRVAEQMGDQAKNPLFLGLICDHIKSGRPFPESGHTLFESYIDHRLSRDRERIARRFRLEVATIRKIAEQVAFCMAADAELGLSPSRERILAAMARQGFEVRSFLVNCLDALEFIKLARADGEGSGAEKLFTFSHRRFQEYFATCLVLTSPARLSPRSLLLDGRWRETATVILQTAPSASMGPLLEAAHSFLGSLEVDFHSALPRADQESSDSEKGVVEIAWPPGLLHVLGILQDGFAGRMDELPVELRTLAGRLVSAVARNGSLADRKWILEVCGSIDGEALDFCLRNGFSSSSRWLAEVAYRQVGRLRRISPDIQRGVLEEMANIFLRGQFWKERLSTLVHLSRLDNPEQFIRSYRLLLSLPIVDGFACVGIFASLVSFKIDMKLLVSASLALLLIWGCMRFTLVLFNEVAGALLRWTAVLMLLVITTHSPWSFVLGTSVLWAPSAYLAAKEGKMTHWWWWPLMPVTWLRAIDYRAILRSFMDFRSLVFSGILLALFQVSVIRGVILFLMLGLLGVFAYFLVRDVFFVYSFSRAVDSPQGIDTTLVRLSHLRFDRARARYLKIVRDSGIFPPSSTTEKKVADLAASVERTGKYGPDVLDELCRLRESLRTEPIAAALPPERITGSA